MEIYDKNPTQGNYKHSRLRNKVLSDRTEMSRKEYKKQRNFCVNLLKRAKKEYFANLDRNSLSDNRKFWQIVKPLFSNKVKGKTTIKLVENDKRIDDEIEIPKLFNEYFVNIVKKLGLFTKEQSAISTENSLSEVVKNDDKTDKENYRSICILPNLSKVYERLMYNQIYPYFQTIFSKFQCGFRKGFNAKHSLSNGRKMAQNPRWRR